MKTEIRIFFAALMFFTRLPCPAFASENYSDQYLLKASRYFSLIGLIVGSIGFGVFVLFSLLLPVSVSVWCSMAAMILATGGFHEDGLADACDGFGGGWSGARILEIMKDSRLGTFGVLGLVVSLGLKQSLLSLLLSEYIIGFWPGYALFLLSHGLSRAAAATYIYALSYAQTDLLSKAKPLSTQMRVSDLVLVGAIGLSPMVFFQDLQILLWLLVAMLPAWLYLRALFVRWLGGYTGDCLGAAQQVFELIILLVLLGFAHFYQIYYY